MGHIWLEASLSGSLPAKHWENLAASEEEILKVSALTQENHLNNAKGVVEKICSAICREMRGRNQGPVVKLGWALRLRYDEGTFFFLYKKRWKN